MADSLREKGATVEFVGAASGIEEDLVPQAGYKLHTLPLKALAGGPIARGRAALLFLRAFGRCRKLIKEFGPGAVLGVGGYASAPAVVAASIMRVPTFLHEQNSAPGRVNRFSDRFSTETLITFPEAAKYLKDTHLVGMPTRREMFDTSREQALEELGLEPPMVLIFGGSGGALRINLAAAEAFSDETPYTVVQVAGRRDFAWLSTNNSRHHILEYVDDMWRYLAAADVVVIRSGAGSLFDTAAVGRASILIPYPYAAGDHQLHNARYFTERDAAELLMDAGVSPEILRKRIEDLLNNSERREKLAARMNALATPEASGKVADTLIRAANEKE
ncbi:MAG: UDP-N-acetylglucosamine--N-acetylmuramyl-(pentapeptide) pyrophosphoryl-undecaprenol N-acetylglucosamine transferase [Rubrobacteraceae bacterium]